MSSSQTGRGGRNSAWAHPSRTSHRLPVRGRSAPGEYRRALKSQSPGRQRRAAKLSTALTSSGEPSRRSRRGRWRGSAGRGWRGVAARRTRTSRKHDRAVWFAGFAHAATSSSRRSAFAGRLRWRRGGRVDHRLDRGADRFPTSGGSCGLDEVAFVVNVEPVLGDVVLEIGDEPLIDDGHGISLPRFAAILLAFAPTRVPGGKGLAWFSVAVTMTSCWPWCMRWMPLSPRSTGTTTGAFRRSRRAVRQRPGG